MKTRRILSNISFNSPSFFKLIIEGLYHDCVIDWAYWIIHYPDKDDKKSHIHFVFQPSRALDTSDFVSKFLEFPFHGNRLPLKPTSRFQPVVSLDDWLLYCKHDSEYLRSKGLERHLHYNWSDFLSTDYDSLQHDIDNIDYNQFGRLALLSEGALNHIPFAELVQRGLIPINYRAQYEAQYIALKRIRDSESGLKTWEKLDAFEKGKNINF